MADQFVLKGVNELRDYTYTGSGEAIAVKNDPRGGSTWQIQKWWDKKSNNTQYVSCTVLELWHQLFYGDSYIHGYAAHGHL